MPHIRCNLTSRVLDPVDSLIRKVQETVPVAHGGVGSYCGQLEAYTHAGSGAVASRLESLESLDITRPVWFCEVGFGSGQSTALMLSTSPAIRVLSFDLFPTNSSRRAFSATVWESLRVQQRTAIAFIDTRWPGRLQRVSGFSNRTIPAFAKQNPGFKCDIISVDGQHSSPEVYYDIQQMSRLARPWDTQLFVDDMSRAALRADLTRAEAEGVVRAVECTALNNEPRHPVFGVHKFCRGRYT